MSIIESTRILIIKAPSDNLGPVEHFLQKRHYKVFVEQDVKMAMVKVIEVDPNIIFLAWDHPNAKIQELPGLMAKACKAVVIPYVMGQSKEVVRKLDICSMNPKLYPPVSGPAIERLVTKFSKVQIRKNADYDEIVGKHRPERELVRESIAPIEWLTPNGEWNTNPNVPQSGETATVNLQNRNLILVRQQRIKKRSEILLMYKKKSLPAEISTELKKTMPLKIKLPLEKMLQSLPGTTEEYRAYCISVFSEKWCGYLTIISNRSLEGDSLKTILGAWIVEHFANALEVDEHDFIEVNSIDPNFAGYLSQNSEYFEKLNISNCDISVGFLSLDPQKMNLELNTENTLIKLATEDIPTDQEMRFSLHLHLQENKKYLVYVQANKRLTPEQKNRLLSNKITQLFTALDFEPEYKKFVVERNIHDFCLSIVKKKSAL